MTDIGRQTFLSQCQTYLNNQFTLQVRLEISAINLLLCQYITENRKVLLGFLVKYEDRN